MGARLGARERPAPAREAQDEGAQRLLACLEERIRQPGRRHRPERVAIAPRVLGCDQPLLAPDPDRDRPPLGQQDCGKCLVVLTLSQISAQPQEILELVRVARAAPKLPLHLLDRVPVEELPELVLSEQLAEEVAV